MSVNISDTLGEIFGTKTASDHTSEDLEKSAQIEFFNGLMAENGIDIGQLEESSLAELFTSAMEMRKSASDLAAHGGDALKAVSKGGFGKKALIGGAVAAGAAGAAALAHHHNKDKEKEADAKLASATSEYTEKRAAAVKLAEADYCGRVMAHAYVDELKKIAGEMPAAFAANAAKKKDGKDKDEKDEKDEKGGKDEKDEDEGKKEAAARAAALITEMAAKTASASSTPDLDEVAAHHAIALLKEAGVDESLAFNRINAVYILGLGESTKIASQTSPEDAIHVRALEFAEVAGFPVTWPE